jgi:hypothetical protein
MQRTIFALTTTAFLAIGLFAASGKAPASARGVLSVLRVDQQVNVKDTPGGYEIGVFEDNPGPLGSKVIEVGSEYLVVRDIANVTTTRIPIYSVKAVVTMKVVE